MTITNNQTKGQKWIRYCFLPAGILSCCALLFYSLGGGKAMAANTKNGRDSIAVGTNSVIPAAEKQNIQSSKLDDNVPMEKTQAIPPKLLFGENYFGKKDTVTQINSSLSPVFAAKPQVIDTIAEQEKHTKIERTKELQKRIKAIYDSAYAAKFGGANYSGYSHQKSVSEINFEKRISDLENKMKADSLQNAQKKTGFSNVHSGVVTYLGNNAYVQNSNNQFYSVGSLKTVAEKNVIQAVIHENILALTGSTIKMRLLTDFRIAEVVIPQGTIVFGFGSITGERYQIRVSSINFNNNIYPVHFVVHDLDGIEGLYIPGLIDREQIKNSGSQMLGSTPIISSPSSLTGQIAQQGISATQNLFSRKIAQIKVNLKANYHILLKEVK